MKTLIGIPCMDMMHTAFAMSLLRMRHAGDTDWAVISTSLVYDARNRIAAKALNRCFDRVLFLDSDMVFQPDLMERMSADLDQGLDMVCGIYFTRRPPILPGIHERITDTGAIPYRDYPRDALFEVAGCGFGAVMMTADLLARVAKKHPSPFCPIPALGEDLTFCRRAAEAGAKIWCDSRIKVGHAGLKIYDETVWEGSR